MCDSVYQYSHTREAKHRSTCTHTHTHTHTTKHFARCAQPHTDEVSFCSALMQTIKTQDVSPTSEQTSNCCSRELNGRTRTATLTCVGSRATVIGGCMYEERETCGGMSVTGVSSRRNNYSYILSFKVNASYKYEKVVHKNT